MSFVLSRTMACALVATGLTLGGCSKPGSGKSTDASSASSETAAMAATFRHMFASNGSATQDRAPAYCIAIGTYPELGDPGPELIAMLADTRPGVVPVSKCDRNKGITDPEYRPSLIFSLQKIECDNGKDCTFQGGYYEGDLSASSGEYHARRTGDAWHVVLERLDAIS